MCHKFSFPIQFPFLDSVMGAYMRIHIFSISTTVGRVGECWSEFVLFFKLLKRMDKDYHSMANLKKPSYGHPYKKKVCSRSRGRPRNLVPTWSFLSIFDSPPPPNFSHFLTKKNTEKKHKNLRPPQWS